jgi:hypothetical protein
VTDSTDCPLDSVPNAAALVVSGDAEPFHFVLRDIDMSGVRLPDLGVWVWHAKGGVANRSSRLYNKDQNIASWNRILVWLGQIDRLAAVL